MAKWRIEMTIKLRVKVFNKNTKKRDVVYVPLESPESPMDSFAYAQKWLDNNGYPDHEVYGVSLSS